MRAVPFNRVLAKIRGVAGDFHRPYETQRILHLTIHRSALPWEWGVGGMGYRFSNLFAPLVSSQRVSAAESAPNSTATAAR
mgnify:CR=1 FL=1